MKMIALATLLIATALPAAGQGFDHKRVCDNFQCRNKAGEVCSSRRDIGRSRFCQSYDNDFRRILVVQKAGVDCYIIDGGNAGWTRCAMLQFDPTKPVR